MIEHSYFNIINRTIWWPKKFGFRGEYVNKKGKRSFFVETKSCS